VELLANGIDPGALHRWAGQMFKQKGELCYQQKHGKATEEIERQYPNR